MWKWIDTLRKRLINLLLSEEERADLKRIPYLKESDMVETALRHGLHNSDDPEEILRGALKTICEFYQGDWCGVLDVDEDLGIWTPYMWHFVEEEDVTLQYFREYEIADYMGRWVAALQSGEVIRLPDTEVIKNENPKEYEIYKRLFVHSVIGVPFEKRPTGFLVVRNPKRYIDEVSLLHNLSYVIVSQINEKNLMDKVEMCLPPIELASDKDVKVNFLGDFEIFTQSGKLDESNFKPKECRLIAYMLLKRKTVLKPKQMAEDLWPDDNCDMDSTNSNLRGRIYDARNTFKKISKYQLIVSTPNGYQINPELNIMTDLQQFEKCCKAAESAESAAERTALLKQAVEMYKGSVFELARSEEWLQQDERCYEIQYGNAVNALLKELADQKDYARMNEYATRALSLTSGNVITYFWMVFSTYHLGVIEMAKIQVERARMEMSSEEYESLVTQLKKAKDTLPLEFRNGRVV